MNINTSLQVLLNDIAQKQKKGSSFYNGLNIYLGSYHNNNVVAFRFNDKKILVFYLVVHCCFLFQFFVPKY